MDFDMVAAALRRDTADLATYARVLTGTLADALPPGCVTVEHERSLGDRLRGRDGRPHRIVVRLGERTLSLTAAAGRPVGEIHHEVRGVVLSRDQVTLDVWVRALAEELLAQAEADARAAEALRRLVAGG
ncbi:hypothetical protein [Actinoallomurus soli]|uniref:hypothetical protein n=1 Tax=Actinoallomurus soli TaxID=2952535 RepID=UPI0020920EB8|nr:hypothetical protein [Actinoallomurus soli]MCO5970866.1 hypothetical protein [Actinoallomurus soli]